MVSLGKLKDPRGFDAIVNGLEDEKYTVRSAAAIAVGRQDANILPVLQNAMSDAESEFLEVDLSALQRLADNWAKQDDTKKGIQKIAPIVRLYLEYPDPRIQAVALRTAASVFDNKELQRTVKRFESTQAPVLQAQVRQLQLMQR